jgi:hypothetical protein
MSFLRNPSLYSPEDSLRLGPHLAKLEANLKNTRQLLKNCEQELEKGRLKGSTVDRILVQQHKDLKDLFTEQTKEKAVFEKKVQTILSTHLKTAASQLFKLGQDLVKRPDKVSNELIFCAAEDALFSAKDFFSLLLSQPENQQETQILEEKAKLCETTWDALCTQREEVLKMKKIKPAEAVKMQKVKESLAPQDLAGNIYKASLDFYSIAQNLLPHPDLLKNDLYTAVSFAYAEAAQQMVHLDGVREWFLDYFDRLQKFKKAESLLQAAFVNSFFRDDSPVESARAPAFTI